MASICVGLIVAVLSGWIGYCFGYDRASAQVMRRTRRRLERQTYRNIAEYETRAAMGIDEKEYQMRRAGLSA
jgi:hypothetical protein